MRTWLVFTVAAVLFAAPALADTWTEEGDATDLPPGQTTMGTNPLEAIYGYLDPDDADMFCVYVEDPSTFSATTCGMTYDTQLFLFDADGIGMSMNDDDPGGCGLQSTVTGAFLPGPGNYLVAIASYDWDPAGANGDIWEDSPYGQERAPDGPGAPGPVIGWGGTGFNDGDYTILLTGAGFCDEPTATEETSWGQVKALFR
ncbi:MAG: hypothetical protein GF346_06325 [Candidatus Eisenbacteria bacterium]|nr:hypothetical protein [Candidatus Latescibacterota bacterium]MBD3302042.1 hypothetical protein [Candidatus Eisenbacteria bacterium]